MLNIVRSSKFFKFKYKCKVYDVVVLVIIKFDFISQYLYWKQMANAATVIQNKYRTYCENKRFKKSKDAAMCIQSYYRTYKEHQTGRSSIRSSRESTPSTSAGIK